MNTVVVRMKDQTSTGKVLNEINIHFESSQVTVKEIIETRVKEEVEAYNEKLPEYFHGLVQPNDAEKTLNGYKLRKHKFIDTEKQVYIALDAFLKNGYFILIDNYQAESLEQVIKLKTNTEINFVKLTPLVGG